MLSARTSAIATALRPLLEHPDVNTWTPLILALMHEHGSPASRWRAYLEALPDWRHLPHPMFWSDQQRSQLLADMPLLLGGVDSDIK